MPIQLPDAAPQPNIALWRRSEMRKGTLPPPSACLLVVEVSDSTVRFDRDQKRLDYAAAGIAEYWTVDLPAQTVVVHLEPASGDRRRAAENGRGRTSASPALGRDVRVDDLLAPRA